MKFSYIVSLVFTVALAAVLAGRRDRINVKFSRLPDKLFAHQGSKMTFRFFVLPEDANVTLNQTALNIRRFNSTETSVPFRVNVRLFESPEAGVPARLRAMVHSPNVTCDTAGKYSVTYDGARQRGRFRIAVPRC